MKTQTPLQNLVFEGLSSSKLAMSDEEIAKWIASMPTIKKDTIEVMRHILFSCYGNKLVYRHLQQMAKECTLMLDALYHYPDAEDRMLPLYQATLDCLTQILAQLQSNYLKYLDPLVAMPKLLYRAAAERIELKAAVLVQAMSSYHADKTLQALVVCKMTGLLKKGTGSWQEIRSLEKLQKWIMELCVGRDSNITEKLKNLLIRADFNTEGFVQYCQSWIAADVADCYELKVQYDLLCGYECDYSRLTNKHKALKFVPGLAKVKDQLLAYVRAELDCMAKKERSTVSSGTPHATIEDYRLPVSVTVEVLAYLFKLLVHTKVVQEKEKHVLMLFLAKNFKTPGTGSSEISLNSLDTKYRQVVKNTALMVRSLLTQMIKELDREFK